MRAEEGVALGRRTVGRTDLTNAAAEDLGVVRLTRDDLGVGPLLLEYPGHALERASGPEAGHPVVERLVLEILQDLLGGGLRVHVGVGLVLELSGEKPAMVISQLLGLFEHSSALLRSGREDHLRSQEAHHLAPLDAEVLGHRDNQRIAFLGTDHRQADTGVAARSLDHRLPGRKLSGSLSVLDHAQRQPILDGTHWIERLDLDEELHAIGRQLLDLHHRRVANCLEDVVELHVLQAPFITAAISKESELRFIPSRNQTSSLDVERSGRAFYGIARELANSKLKTKNSKLTITLT